MEGRATSFKYPSFRQLLQINDRIRAATATRQGTFNPLHSCLLLELLDLEVQHKFELLKLLEVQVGGGGQEGGQGVNPRREKRPHLGQQWSGATAWQ